MRILIWPTQGVPFRQTVLVCFLTLLLAINSWSRPAMARDDPPYSGFVAALQLGPEFDDRLDTACAIEFRHRMPDGRFIDYHVDPVSLRAEGQLCYVEWDRGECTFDATINVETCVSEPGLVGPLTEYIRFLGADFANVPMAISSSPLGVMFMSAEAQLIRCPIPEQNLRRHISGRSTRLTWDEIWSLKFGPYDHNRGLIERTLHILDNPSPDTLCNPGLASTGSGLNTVASSPARRLSRSR